jgi:hypothetical protein
LDPFAIYELVKNFNYFFLHRAYQNQQKIPEPESYLQNESFGMYDREDEEFMSNLEMNDSAYSANEHNNSLKSEPKPGSLLYGNYDEAAEAAAFQQALNAWRNPQSSSTQTPRTEPKKPAKKAVNFAKPKSAVASKDSNVGTDLDESGRSTFRALEEQIQANHSLTCAERMLLFKLRRDGKENKGDQSFRSNSTLKSERDARETNKNYLIEEIPQSNSFKKGDLFSWTVYVTVNPQNQ